mgnify:CR=1 FL=1
MQYNSEQSFETFYSFYPKTDLIEDEIIDLCPDKEFCLLAYKAIARNEKIANFLLTLLKRDIANRDKYAMQYTFLPMWDWLKKHFLSQNELSRCGN